MDTYETILVFGVRAEGRAMKRLPEGASWYSSPATRPPIIGRPLLTQAAREVIGQTAAYLHREQRPTGQTRGRMWLSEKAQEVMQTRISKGFVTSKENMLEKLMLIVSEAAEAAEDVRHGNWDHFGEELADVLIRVMDIGATLQIDLEAEVEKKMEKNAQRPHLHGLKTNA